MMRKRALSRDQAIEIQVLGFGQAREEGLHGAGNSSSCT